MYKAPKPASGLFAAAMMLFVVVATQSVRAAPPYSGTAFLDPDIITPGAGVPRVHDPR